MMKIVRNAVLREDNKIQIAMIAIAVFMILIPFFSLTIDFESGGIGFSNHVIASAVSIIPITWGVCSALLIKTKKVFFSKLPMYLICVLLLLALCIYIIAEGEENLVFNILAFAVVVLLAYPFVIAVLTLEGRLYNRVFAILFSSILLGISLIFAVVLSVILNVFMAISLIPAIIYTELILSVLCYRLEKPAKVEEY